MAKLTDTQFNRIISGNLEFEEHEKEQIKNLPKPKFIVDSINELTSEQCESLKLGDTVAEDVYLYVVVNRGVEQIYLACYVPEDKQLLVTEYTFDNEWSFVDEYVTDVNNGIDSLQASPNLKGQSLVVGEDGTIITNFQPTLYKVNDSWNNLSSAFIESLKQGDVIFNGIDDNTAFVTSDDNTEKDLTVFIGSGGTSVKVYILNDDTWEFSEESTKYYGTKLYKHRVITTNYDFTLITDIATLTYTSLSDQLDDLFAYHFFSITKFSVGSNLIYDYDNSVLLQFVGAQSITEIDVSQEQIVSDTVTPL